MKQLDFWGADSDTEKKPMNWRKPACTQEPERPKPRIEYHTVTVAQVRDAYNRFWERRGKQPPAVAVDIIDSSAYSYMADNDDWL